jgi:hypothetical protein
LSSFIGNIVLIRRLRLGRRSAKREGGSLAPRQ